MQRSLSQPAGVSFVSVRLDLFSWVAAFAIGGQSLPIFTEYQGRQKSGAESS